MTPTTLPPNQPRAARSHHSDLPHPPSSPHLPRGALVVRAPRTARPCVRAPRPASRDTRDAPAGGTIGSPCSPGSHGSHAVLGRYTDSAGRPREVVARPAYAGTVLVIDRDAATRGDRRLVAHLAADEPPENASLVCRHYLRDPRTPRCRALTPEDLHAVPLAAGCDRFERGPVPELDARLRSGARELRDHEGRLHRLEAIHVGKSIPELRWRRYPAPGDPPEPRTESVRDVVACFESYEPIRTLTAATLARHREDPDLSVAVLRAELARIDASRIVLNRELRRAVQRAIRTQGLSLSEIAVRCGRLKRDGKGKTSGETTWLARRVGIAPESGRGVPTPWIHSEVLALIARRGLGICPREVEL